jgi:hypothetical protein
LSLGGNSIVGSWRIVRTTTAVSIGVHEALLRSKCGVCGQIHQGKKLNPTETALLLRLLICLLDGGVVCEPV